MIVSMFIPIFLTLASVVKFVEPKIEKSEWKNLNEKLKEKLVPIHHHLCRSQTPEDIITLGDQANIVIRDFLLEHPELFETVESTKKTKFKKHNSKALEEAVKLKKELKRKAEHKDATEDDKKKFRLVLRAISDLRKAEKRREEAKTSEHYEKQYNKNKWKFAKKAVNGDLDKLDEPPGFTKAEADEFYPQTYSVPKMIDINQLNWFPHLPISPENDNFTNFSMDPIRPRDIKNTLLQCNKNSSPGPDGIPYSILLKLPTTHHTLATLYNKVLQTGYAPRSWSESVVKLLHKSGPTNVQTNFRMIALTNCIGKIYHLILSRRFTDFLTANKYVDNKLSWECHTRGYKLS